MNRADFQQLAEIRVEEAAALLAAQKWDGAYYLAGYAVECALKACIAKQTNQYDFPPPKKVIDDYYTHDLEKLLNCAGLFPTKDAAVKLNKAFEANWIAIIKWKEISRYERKSKDEAELMYNAVSDPTNGVLQWLKNYW